ncbi:sensor histidine kinase [Vallitalea guaymasensis]|uniref:sensor histidine kinase n=1 Tax=Vallitalea guaymasensis TaxID=1185412 RepID=UPI000DE39914|nr:sensor histidine kinase [Vallitalea guaymasensis]
MYKKIIYRYNKLNKQFFVSIICLLLVISTILLLYFNNYHKPYMNKNVQDISHNWTYYTNENPTPNHLSTLQHIRDIDTDETLILTKELKRNVENGALLIKSNHQHIEVFIDHKTLLKTNYQYNNNLKNPGMSLYFVQLPDRYAGKTLTIKITSPYKAYSGAASSIYLGDIPSLEAFTLSKSMPHFILMIICILLGIGILILYYLQKCKGSSNISFFFFGIFAIVWGLYYPCTDYIVYQFFQPQWVSLISIGLYFLIPIPLTLSFYFRFTFCRKYYIPLVISHILFTSCAYILQAFAVVDFPEMLNINNILYAISVFIVIVLSLIEMFKGNVFLRFTTPWVILAYVAIIRDFIVFYTTRMEQQSHIYKAMFFILILVILLFSVLQYLKQTAQQQADMQTLKIKEQLTIENYKNINTHLQQVSVLKHEMKNHILSLSLLMENNDYEKARSYLDELSSHSNDMLQVFYTHNYLINAILNSKLTRASKLGIKVTHKILVPKKLSILDSDLCSLLMNIIDNAIEACIGINENITTYIDLTIHVRNNYLYVSCKNSKTNNITCKNSKYISTKSDNNNHGFGIMTIEQISNKYNGIMDITYDTYNFTISVCLKL